jgi:small subunit ribosomal protein S2
VAVIAGVLGRAGQAGQKRRLSEARETGRATWQNPKEIHKFMQLEAQQKAAEQMRELTQHRQEEQNRKLREKEEER